MREEIGRLGAGGSHATPVLSYPKVDGNNIVLASEDLAIAQAQLHTSSVALYESRDVLELLLPSM